MKTQDNNLLKKRIAGLSLRNILIGAVLLLLAIPAIIYGGRWIHYRLTRSITNDAFIEADFTYISSLVSGHIQEVLVDESSKIDANQILARIRPTDYKAVEAITESALNKVKQDKIRARVGVDKAQTALELIKREVETGIRTARAQLASAKAKFVMVAKDERRLAALLDEKVISQSRYDAQKSAYDQAIAAVKAGNAVLDRALAQKKRIVLAKKDLAVAQQKLSAAKAAVEVAERQLDQAKINLSHTTIKAPLSGIVARKFINPGDFVGPGQPLFFIYDPGNLFVIANLEETKVDGVKLNCPVEIQVDAFPRKMIKGKVVRITPAAAAKFALIPRDVTAGEFTKVVQRVPIKISLDIPDDIVLSPGMSVEVRIKRDE
jgi:membrane fusion protein (multidrug efflux system)